MSKLITVCLSYYNQPKEVVLRHLNYWKSYNTETSKRFIFFIIDDCSKIPIHELLDKSDCDGLDLRMYRVNENKYCNIAGVRNLGATECETEWMVILDMDTCIPTEMAQKLISLAEGHRDAKQVFKFNRNVPGNKGHKKHNKDHPAVCLIERKDYWHIGGCEEDLVGHYGFTDPSFWHRAKGKVSVTVKRDICLDYYPDGESDINRNTRHNKKLFEEKVRDNSWSTDRLRFTWSRINFE